VAAARARAAAQPAPQPPLATTLVVLATDATLAKAQCQKVSGIGHDGLARAIDPVHTMFDGDTVFTLATGDRPAPDPAGFHSLLVAAATTVTRAVARGVVTAESAGGMRGYREAFPSASV
jgi:putative pantetheine hydrolase